MTLQELREQRNEAAERLHTASDAIIEVADDADKDTVDGLQARFDEAHEAHERINARVEQRELVEEAKRNSPISPVEDDEAVQERTTDAGDARVTREPLTYERDSGTSYFADLYQAGKGDNGARERLGNHMTEMVQERAISSTAGAGGEFVAPLYLQNEWIKLARAARPLADAVKHMPLPPNANSIIVPKVLTGAATASQVDNAAVQSTDITTGTITVPVITVAGQQDVSRQLLERSVPGIDEVIFGDLVADYNTKVDLQVLSGSGTGGNAKGIANVSGPSASTYTDATPTVPELYSKIADVIQQVHTGRFLPPQVIVMHPRRWGWILAALDSQNRPLVPPTAPMNPMGVLENVASENLVGQLLGLPVIVDASVTTTAGAGTNEDRIFVLRTDDLILFEDAPVKTKVFEEVLSNTLAIRVQVYNYLAFTPDRYARSTGVISGTGLVTPTF